MQAEAIVSSLNLRQGEINLAPVPVDMTTPPGFSFINRLQAEQVLSDIWGNPRDTGALGLLVPNATDFLDNAAWGIVIQYLPRGHVGHAGFSAVDFDAMLADMQQATRMATLERAQQGYRGLELVGWAAKPILDADRHAIIWARLLEDPADRSQIINYNVRLLGRRGTLVLKAVAPAEIVPDVERSIGALLALTGFRVGHRYQDFDAGQDALAPFGLEGLVSETLEPISNARNWWVWGSVALFTAVVATILLVRSRYR